MQKSSTDESEEVEYYANANEYRANGLEEQLIKPDFIGYDTFTVLRCFALL